MPVLTKSLDSRVVTVSAVAAIALLVSLAGWLAMPYQHGRTPDAPGGTGLVATGSTPLTSTPVSRSGSTRPTHVLYDTGVVVVYEDKTALSVQRSTVLELENGVKILSTGEVVGSSGYQLGFMKRGDAIVIGTGTGLDWRKGSGATAGTGGLRVASGSATPEAGPLGWPAGEIVAALYGSGGVKLAGWSGSIAVSWYRPYTNQNLKKALAEKKRVIVLVGTGSCAACDALRDDVLRNDRSIPKDTIVLDLPNDPGAAVSRRLGVAQYPTAILLDVSGKPKAKDPKARAFADLAANLFLVR